MQLDFLGELAFRPDAVAVADNEHSDHQLGIDRRTADVTVMGSEFLMQISERNSHENVHAPQQVALGDAIFQPELVEQTTLMPSLPPHHRPVPVADDQSATGITVRRPSQALFRHHRSFATNLKGVTVETQRELPSP